MEKAEKQNDGYLLAFGQGEFFTFVLEDANQIVRELPDVEKWNEVMYSAVRVHNIGFFPFCARLAAKGLKVAMVARRVGPHNKVGYYVTGRSDD